MFAIQNDKSFNHAIAQRAKKVVEEMEHHINMHGLYKEQFDPILPFNEITGAITNNLVKTHIDELIQADIVIIVHPNWWGWRGG